MSGLSILLILLGSILLGTAIILVSTLMFERHEILSEIKKENEMLIEEIDQLNELKELKENGEKNV